MSTRCLPLALLAAATWLPQGRSGELPARYLPVKDVRRGMRGYGLSVFRGTRIERFEVEVLGVLRNRMPKQDMILIRMQGARLETTGVIAGMSGSPIYLKVGDEHKLAGAVAYGWPFPKEPVCGVTPIENMYAVATSRLGERPEGAAAAGGRLDKPVRLAGRTITEVRLAAAPSAWDALSGHAAVLTRLRTPLYVSGLSEPALAMLRSELVPLGFLPVQAGGAADADEHRGMKLEPGSAVLVTLAEGDVTMSGGGTVTDVVGNTVLAFGHPMLGEGRVNVPIATGAVELSFASVVRSFKMTRPIQTVGRLRLDAQAAVVGTLGEEARMIPVEARLRRSDLPGEETFSVRIIDHPRLTPKILATFLANSLMIRGGFPEENTVAFRATIELAGHEPLVYENVRAALDSEDAIKKAFNDIVKPVSLVCHNPFGDVQIERIRAEFEVRGRDTSAAIQTVRLDCNECRPGETLRAVAVLRPYKGEPVAKTLELTVPEDYPPGRASVEVCDAETHQSKLRNEAPHRYRPQNLAQLLGALREEVPQHRLFLRLKLPDRGIARQGSELPSLPQSAFNVIASQKLTGLVVTGRSVVAHVDTPFVLKGSHTVPVLIRPREVE